MKVNERRTVVGGVDWPLCGHWPPTVERDRRAWWSRLLTTLIVLSQALRYAPNPAPGLSTAQIILHFVMLLPSLTEERFSCVVFSVVCFVFISSVRCACRKAESAGFGLCNLISCVMLNLTYMYTVSQPIIGQTRRLSMIFHAEHRRHILLIQLLLLLLLLLSFIYDY